MISVNKQTLEFWDTSSVGYDEGTKRCKYFDFVSEWIVKHARELEASSECRVLDLGCGTGLNVRLLRAQRVEVRAEGLDISSKMIERAQENGGYEKLYEHNLDVPLPEGPSETFDLAIAFGFLEFLTDAYVCLSECRRALKAGGKLWVTLQRFEANDVGSPPRFRSFKGMRVRGYSAGEIFYMMKELNMHITTFDSAIGYITQNGFGCPYYVMSATKIQ